MTAPVVAGAVGLAAAGLALLRFGVRNRRAVRLLARAINAPSRIGPVRRATGALHARLYGASGGRLLRWWFGSPVLVIETTGRRSGRTRRTAIVYARDGERWIVTPAAGGSDRTPAWWLNLRASGRATVLVGGRRREVTAREAQGEERERLWRRLLHTSRAIEDYQSFTARRFAVVVLEPE